MREPVLAYIGLGANLGDAAATLTWAMAQVAAWPYTQVVAQSALYRSAPVDATGPDFINAVMGVYTCFDAPDMLDMLQNIEHLAGRERPYRNAPRTLDLDLLLYGDSRVDSTRLQVPHPRMFQRAFVLRPLAEIAAQCVSAAQLAAVQDQACTRM